MTPDYFDFSSTSTTNAVCVGPRNLYIFTTSSFVPTVAMTYDRIASVSASNAMMEYTVVIGNIFSRPTF